MSAAPEQVERHLLVGLLQHNNQTAVRMLAEKIGNGVDWIRGQGRLEDHNVGGKFLNGANRLFDAFGLSDHPDVILEGKDLAQAGAENGLGIGHNDADRAFAVLKMKTVAWLNADRSAAHLSSFAPYPRGRLKDAANRVSTSLHQLLHPLPAFETILVNDHTDSTPAAVFKTAYHSSAAIHLHVCFRADYIGGKRDRKIHGRTYRNIGIHAEQDSVGGNVLGLDRLSPNSRAGVCRLHCHRQLDGKARRALHVRITPSILAAFSNSSLGGFRHVCDDLPSGLPRAPLQLKMCTFQAEITPQHQPCKVTEVMEQERRSAFGTGTYGHTKDAVCAITAETAVSTQ